MTQQAPPRIRCRIITEDDAPALARLLLRGFPNRSLDYWTRALDTLATRAAPENFPRFGFLLEHEGSLVGVVLMIFHQNVATAVRCNISSWYVDDAYRGYASLLIAAALRYKDVTYINISPAPHTWPVIEAQGFRRYCNGQMMTLPFLSPQQGAARIEAFDPSSDCGLTAYEHELMTDHTARGCLGLIARSRADAHPFLFLPRRILRDWLPTSHLVYCRSLDDYVRLAHPLGRALLARGYPTVLVDANAHIDGLRGLFFADRGPKYFRGPEPPRLGDLTFCESILFGP